MYFQTFSTQITIKNYQNIANKGPRSYLFHELFTPPPNPKASAIALRQTENPTPLFTYPFHGFGQNRATKKISPPPNPSDRPSPFVFSSFFFHGVYVYVLIFRPSFLLSFLLLKALGMLVWLQVKPVPNIFFPNE